MLNNLENKKIAFIIVFSTLIMTIFFKFTSHLKSVTISTSDKEIEDPSISVSEQSNQKLKNIKLSRMIASTNENEQFRNTEESQGNFFDQEITENQNALNSIATNHPYLNTYIRGFQQAQVNYYRAQKIFGKGEIQDAINSYIALGDLYADPNIIAPSLQKIIDQLNENPEFVIQLIAEHQFSKHQDSFIELQLINMVMNINLQTRFKFDFLHEIISRNTTLIDESEGSVNFLPAIIALKNSNAESDKIQKLFDQGLNQLQDEQSKLIYRQAFNKYFPEVIN